MMRTFDVEPFENATHKKGMGFVPQNHLELPEEWGWFYPGEAAVAQSLHDELQREFPPGHLLFLRKVETVAYRKDCDDVLFRHVEEPDRFTVIHLTWIRKREVDAKHPSVCFDGTFSDFVAGERKAYELDRGSEPSELTRGDIIGRRIDEIIIPLLDQRFRKSYGRGYLRLDSGVTIDLGDRVPPLSDCKMDFSTLARDLEYEAEFRPALGQKIVEVRGKGGVGCICIVIEGGYVIAHLPEIIRGHPCIFRKEEFTEKTEPLWD